MIWQGAAWGAGCHLTLGVITPFPPEKVRPAYLPIAQYLSRQTDCQIVLPDHLPLTYAEGIKRLKAAEWDLAFATNDSYLETRRQYEALVTVSERKSSFYRSVVVTADDGPIRKIDDLRGKSLAFVATESASGFIYPLKTLLEKGVDPCRDARPIFVGSPQMIGYGVARRSYDAGAVFEGFLSENPEIGRRLRVLARSEPIPNVPVVASRKLLRNPELVGRIRQALLRTAHDAPDLLQKPPEIYFDGFLAPSPGFYESFERVRRNVRAYLTRTRCW